MGKEVLVFRRDGHVTPRTFRYEEINKGSNLPKGRDGWLIGKLYVQKRLFDGAADERPNEVKVTLEW